MLHVHNKIFIVLPAPVPLTLGDTKFHLKEVYGVQNDRNPILFTNY